jgi:hypothetical protein
MLVSWVPACTECIGWGIGISADSMVVTEYLVLVILVGTTGSKVLYYLFILKEDHDLMAF